MQKMPESPEQSEKDAQFALPRFRLPDQRYIYVMACGDVCKVGLTWDAKKRLRGIQAANHQPVELVAVYPVPPQGTEWAEREAHQRLAEHRVRGEWFRVSKEVACAAAQDAVNYVQFGNPSKRRPRRSA